MLMSDALCIVKYLIHDLPIPDLGSKVTVLTVHPILFIGALYHLYSYSMKIVIDNLEMKELDSVSIMLSPDFNNKAWVWFLCLHFPPPDLKHWIGFFYTVL